jgi:hypothetical protein
MLVICQENTFPCVVFGLLHHAIKCYDDVAVFIDGLMKVEYCGIILTGKPK